MLHKDLLSLEGLTRSEIENLLQLSLNLKRRLKRGEKLSHLTGERLVLMFYEPSTRTRISFAQAAYLGGADVISVAADTSSVTKGESLVDTARTLAATGATALVLRHGAAGAAALVARKIPIPVINAGDGWHAHPTQSLLDLLTIWEKRGRVEGLKIAILGDVLHSRVARSNIEAFSKLGAKVKVSAPPTLLPSGLTELGAQIVSNPAAAVADADVIYLLRVQRERQAEGYLASLSEYSRLWGLDNELLAKAPHNALIMHPGPANIGVEVSYDVATSPQAVITDQVSNGVLVRLAVLTNLLGGEKECLRLSQAVAS